eukprot:5461445-Pleurochrysis_carterae.AAC.1
MSATGRIAFMSFAEHMHSVAIKTCNFRGLGVEDLNVHSPPLRVSLQIEAARRRTRQFVPVVIKNAEL